MKLAVAFEFFANHVQAAAVAFDAWDALEPGKTCTTRVAVAAKLSPVERDQCRLAALLQLLCEQALGPELIVFVGLVHLDGQGSPGWGQLIYDALGGRVAVIGISKRLTPGLPAQFEVLREIDAPPVVVTCVGIDIGAAKARVRAMHGKRRLPTLLKLATRSAKGSD